MTGVAQRITLAAAACAYRDHEAVGLDHAAVGHLDANRPLHHHRSRRHHPHNAGLVLSHALSALITNSSSPRRPGSSRPVSSNPCARDDITGPKGIHSGAMPSASRPVLASWASVSRGPANSDWTSSIVPPLASSSFAV